LTKNVLFENDPVNPIASKPIHEIPGVPRVHRAVRDQIEIVYGDLESLITDDHQVRTVWRFVEQADLSPLYAQIRSVEGSAGRAAIDPKILLALWLYAILDGIGSARALEKLCSDHNVYRWICGGVAVNYHTISDFRSESNVLDKLLTDMVMRLRSTGLVSMNRVAHDGIRVRANAGGSSFRTEKKLLELRQEAEQQIEALNKEREEDPGASDLRRRSARERAARERSERIDEALRQFPALEQKKKTKAESSVCQ